MIKNNNGDLMMSVNPTNTVSATQHYASSIERAFQAWTDPVLLQRWFGPPGTKATVVQHEFTVGGRWRIRMTTGDGNEFYHFGSFLEISNPERLVFTWASEEQIEGWRDADENPTVVTVKFSAAGDGVDIQVTHENLIGDTAFTALSHGWNGSLLRLKSHI